MHCTATTQTTTVQSILNYWKKSLGWKNPGYHRLIEANGKVHTLLPDELISNGVAGYNSNSLHVSYIGGIDAKGKALDTRTPEQKAAILSILKEWKAKHPKAVIRGHRDFPNVKKSCPSFDVAGWLNATSNYGYS